MGVKEKKPVVKKYSISIYLYLYTRIFTYIYVNIPMKRNECIELLTLMHYEFVSLGQ